MLPVIGTKLSVMANSWESRERNVKRIALIVSILIHLCVLVAITQSVGGGIGNLIEHVFGGDQPEPVAEAKV